MCHEERTARAGVRTGLRQAAILAIGVVSSFLFFPEYTPAEDALIISGIPSASRIAVYRWVPYPNPRGIKLAEGGSPLTVPTSSLKGVGKIVVDVTCAGYADRQEQYGPPYPGTKVVILDKLISEPPAPVVPSTSSPSSTGPSLPAISQANPLQNLKGAAIDFSKLMPGTPTNGPTTGPAGTPPGDLTHLDTGLLSMSKLIEGAGSLECAELQQARVWEKGGQIDKTLALCQQVLDGRPKSKDALSVLKYLVALHSQRNEMGEAGKRLEELRAGFPEEDKALARGRYDIAVNSYYKQNYGMAAEQWQLLLKEHPDRSDEGEVLFLIGFCLKQDGKMAQAVPYYERIMKEGIHADYAWMIPQQLGIWYLNKGQDYEKAAYWLGEQRKRYLARGGEFSRQAFSLEGLAYLKMKQYDKAVEVFEEYLKTYDDEQTVPVRCNLAKAKEGRDDIAGAVSVLEEALRRYGDGKFNVFLLKEWETLQARYTKVPVEAETQTPTTGKDPNAKPAADAGTPPPPKDPNLPPPGTGAGPPVKGRTDEAVQ